MDDKKLDKIEKLLLEKEKTFRQDKSAHIVIIDNLIKLYLQYEKLEKISNLRNIISIDDPSVLLVLSQVEIMIKSKIHFESTQKAIIENKEKITEMEKKVQSYIDRDRIRMAEFLGIFAAVIAFVFVSKDLIIRFSFIQTLLLLPAFSLGLIFFVVGIDYIVRPDRSNWKKIFLIVVVFLLLVISIGITYYASRDNFADFNPQSEQFKKEALPKEREGAIMHENTGVDTLKSK